MIILITLIGVRVSVSTERRRNKLSELIVWLNTPID